MSDENGELQPERVDGARADDAVGRCIVQQGVSGHPDRAPTPLRIEDRGGADPSRSYWFNLGSDKKLYGRDDPTPPGQTLPLEMRVAVMQGIPHVSITVYHRVPGGYELDGGTSLVDNYELTSDQGRGFRSELLNEHRFNQFLPQPGDYVAAFRAAIEHCQNRGKLFLFTVEDPSAQVRAGGDRRLPLGALAGAGVAIVLGTVVGLGGAVAGWAPGRQTNAAGAFTAQHPQPGSQTKPAPTKWATEAQGTLTFKDYTNCNTPVSGQGAPFPLNLKRDGSTLTLNVKVPGATPVVGSIDAAGNAELKDALERWLLHLTNSPPWTGDFYDTLPNGCILHALVEIRPDSQIQVLPVTVPGPVLAGSVNTGAQGGFGATLSGLLIGSGLLLILVGILLGVVSLRGVQRLAGAGAADPAGGDRDAIGGILDGFAGMAPLAAERSDSDEAQLAQRRALAAERDAESEPRRLPGVSKDLENLYIKLADTNAKIVEAEQDSGPNFSSYDSLQHLLVVRDETSKRILLYLRDGSDAVNVYDDENKREFAYGTLKTTVDLGGGAATGEAANVLNRLAGGLTPPAPAPRRAAGSGGGSGGIGEGPGGQAPEGIDPEAGTIAENPGGEPPSRLPTPEQQATAIEVRGRAYDKLRSRPLSAEQVQHYEDVRARDIRSLRDKGPEWWDQVTDPQTHSYLRRLLGGNTRPQPLEGLPEAVD